MRYLAVFIWHDDDTATWSVHVNTLDKQEVVNALLRDVDHNSLDSAEILVIENGKENPRFTEDVMETEPQKPPKVVRHWSAANGDFEDVTI